MFGLKSINQAVAWLFEAQCLLGVFMLIGAPFTLYPYTCKSSSSDADEGEANSDNRPPALNFSVFHPFFFFLFSVKLENEFGLFHALHLTPALM